MRYSEGHLWVRVEGKEAVIGLSDYVPDQMGEITEVTLPDLGDMIRRGRLLGHAESEEASSPITAPVTGEVVEVNGDVLASPDVINSDPYDGGWLVRVRLEDPTEIEELMSEEEYAEVTTEV